MFRKFLAGLVLALLCGWSVPVARAAAPQSDDLTARKPASHPSSGHDHSCCPSLHSRIAPPVFVTVVPTKRPCGDQHPCCARQAPDSPPLLPAISRMPRPDLRGLLAALPDQGCRGAGRTAADTLGSGPIQSYSVRSTILRI